MAFLSLIFILILAFVVQIMDAASLQMAKNYRRADMNRAVECTFAEYQTDLLEHYDIFALDAGYQTGSFHASDLKNRLEFYGVSGVTQKIVKSQFLTDDGCQAFIDQVYFYMNQTFGSDIIGKYTGSTSLWNQQKNQALYVQNESEDEEQDLTRQLSENNIDLSSEENPISHISNLKAMSVLNLVMPHDKTVSDKTLTDSDLLTDRSLNQGSGDFSEESFTNGSVSMLLLGEYLIRHFQNALSESDGRPLDYELEYMIAGKKSDRENLESVVQKLILLRYLPNYAYIQTDAEMKAEARTMAGTFSFLVAAPEFTEAVAQGILLAWAYGESIMDVRTLLKGNKVPLVKTKSTWQLSLGELLKLGTSEERSDGADVSGGIDYQTYLRMLLFLEKPQTVSKRALCLIEENLQNVYGKSWFRADICLSRIEWQSKANLRRGITYTFPTYYGYN